MNKLKLVLLLLLQETNIGIAQWVCKLQKRGGLKGCLGKIVGSLGQLQIVDTINNAGNDAGKSKFIVINIDIIVALLYQGNS